MRYIPAIVCLVLCMLAVALSTSNVQRSDRAALDAENYALEAARAHGQAAGFSEAAQIAAAEAARACPQVSAEVLRVCSRVLWHDQVIGSCVFLGEREVLTAAHVVLWDEEDKARDDLSVEIRLADGSRVWSPAALMRFDRAHDCALLKIEADLPFAAELATDEELKSILAGAALLQVGTPYSGSAWVASPGFLAAKSNEELDAGDEAYLWQASTTVNYGCSGGGLFDPRSGKVFGIAVQGRGDWLRQRGCCYFVPANYLRALIEGHADAEAPEE